jgi:hypothetical protein
VLLASIFVFGMSCYRNLEDLLLEVDNYEQDSNASKTEFVASFRACIFKCISDFLTLPLGKNMALPFADNAYVGRS